MATNFPTSLDVLTTGGNLPNTITSSTELDATNFLHDEMHVNVNESSVAVQTKMGIGSSTPSAAGQVLTCDDASGTTTWQSLDDRNSPIPLILALS